MTVTTRAWALLLAAALVIPAAGGGAALAAAHHPLQAHADAHSGNSYTADDPSGCDPAFMPSTGEAAA
ncbi:MAG TPA: hypothetical protein VFD32_19235 [Dehalococcoidia bacterium]|nr:hypothetical protein [Dehalococcoidia bacterium]